jgi:uncharacterized membrane protein YagU involved in acid resistance
MSGFMVLGEAAGLLKSPPPKHITHEAERKAGMEPQEQSGATFSATWLAAHVAYGTASGVAYGLLQGVMPRSRVSAGLAYGAALWGFSYLGLMPALGLYPFPKDDDNSRIAVMIAAHGVYGEVLAGLAGGGCD